MLKRIGAEESGEFKAVASGTLPSGRPVVVNADGTVSVVSSSTFTQAVGSAAVFESANTDYPFASFDTTNNKVLIVYSDSGNSNYGTAVVGTIDTSDNSISFGTPVVFASSSVQDNRVAFSPDNGKFLIAYKDNNATAGKVIVGTVSGTTVSFGTAATFANVDAISLALVYNEASSGVGFFVIAYKDSTNSGHGKAVVVSILANGTPNVYTPATFAAVETTPWPSSIAYDSVNQKTIIAYRDDANSNKGTAIVATRSTGTLSFGSEVLFNNGASQYITAVYDSTNGKVVIGYQDYGDSSKGTAVVGTVSGTSISFGSESVFNTGDTRQLSGAFDVDGGKVIFGYADAGNSNQGTFVVGTVSGTSISFASEVVFEAGAVSTHLVSTAYCSTIGKIVFAYRDNDNSNYGTAIVLQNAYTSNNLTSENYIGMSRGVVFQSESAASTPSLGGATVFRSGETDDITSAYDTNSNKLVVAYIESNVQGAGTAVVGTVSGTSITFGSPVTFESSNISGNVKMTFDSSSNKIVIAYRANNLNGVAIVGTVSGTSISFGSAVTFLSSRLEGTTIAFDSNSNKVVIAYNDYDNGGDGKAVVGTVSGTSISFGSAVTFETGTFSQQTSVFDSNSNKVVIAYSETSGSVFYAIVGTVSGTSISFGSKTTIFSGATTSFASTFDSDTNKIMVLYTKDDANSYGNLVVGTVSGTSISFGSEVVFKSGTVYQRDCSYDTAVNKVIISFRDASNSNKMTYLFATISGTSASISSETVSILTDSRAISSVYDPDSGGTLVSFTNGSTTYGTTQVVNSSAIITTRGEVASGGNASMDIIGSVSDNQIGLTTGQQYFVQTDGTISTTAGSPSVLAGTAISATELVVKT